MPFQSLSEVHRTPMIPIVEGRCLLLLPVLLLLGTVIQVPLRPLLLKLWLPLHQIGFHAKCGLG